MKPSHPYKNPPALFLAFWRLLDSDRTETPDEATARIIRAAWRTKHIPDNWEPTAELALMACAVEARYPNQLNPFSPAMIAERWNAFAETVARGGAQPYAVSGVALRHKCEQAHQFLLA